jgi:hypothetical protein
VSFYKKYKIGSQVLNIEFLSTALFASPMARPLRGSYASNIPAPSIICGLVAKIQNSRLDPVMTGNRNGQEFNETRRRTEKGPAAGAKRCLHTFNI